jgi:hypothetical protein
LDDMSCLALSFRARSSSPSSSTKFDKSIEKPSDSSWSKLLSFELLQDFSSRVASLTWRKVSVPVQKQSSSQSLHHRTYLCCIGLVLSLHNTPRRMSSNSYGKFCMGDRDRTALWFFRCRPCWCIRGLFPCSRFIDGSLFSILCSTSLFAKGPSVCRPVGLSYGIIQWNFLSSVCQ